MVTPTRPPPPQMEKMAEHNSHGQGTTPHPAQDTPPPLLASSENHLPQHNRERTKNGNNTTRKWSPPRALPPPQMEKMAEHNSHGQGTTPHPAQDTPPPLLASSENHLPQHNRERTKNGNDTTRKWSPPRVLPHRRWGRWPSAARSEGASDGSDRRLSSPGASVATRPHRPDRRPAIPPLSCCGWTLPWPIGSSP